MNLDSVAEGYLRFLKYSNEGRKIILSLEKIFDFNRKSQFLDVGAGDGRIIIPLSKKVGFTVALEPSEYLANLLKSKIRGKSNIKIIMTSSGS